MSKENENLLPDEYWNELTQEEIESLQSAADEMEQYLSHPVDEWIELDESYYEHLRERFKKGPDEIGPRQSKLFQNKFIPVQMMVIPAGRQYNGEEMVQYFHIITEDLELGECNGSYELVTKKDLEEKFNIKYNN